MTDAKRASLLSSQTRELWSRGWAMFNVCGSRGPSSAAAIPCDGRTRRCSIRCARRCTPIGRVRTWPRPPKSYVRRSRTSSDSTVVLRFRRGRGNLLHMYHPCACLPRREFVRRRANLESSLNFLSHRALS